MRDLLSVPTTRHRTRAPRADAREDMLAKAGKVLARLQYPRAGDVLAVTDKLTASLSHCTRSTTTGSDITDDGTPFEISLAFEPGGIVFRLLWEAQVPGGRASLPDLWAAAELVNHAAATLDGVTLEPLDRIKEAFFPRFLRPSHFAMWHALAFDRSGGFLIKAYLNPAVTAQPTQASLDAMAKLGQPRLAELTSRLLSRRPQDRLAYFSVDLTTRSRTKVYIAHPGVTTGELEKLLSGLPGYPSGGAASAIISKLCGSEGPFQRRPVLTCLSGRSGDHEPGITLHFPVRSYVRRDADVISGLQGLLEPGQLETLNAILTEDLRMPPETGKGAISYVSTQWNTGTTRTTVYLQPHFLQRYGLAPH